MAVIILVPGLWRAATAGASRAETPAGPLAAVLEALVAQYPGLYSHLREPGGAIRPGLNFFVNRQHVRYLGGLAATLHDGDELRIIPLVAGG